MIISRLFCGLGNQMFQYAAGLALAAQRRTVLKLDVSWFGEKYQRAAHEVYGLSCFNVTEQFATDLELDFHRGLQRTATEDRFFRVCKFIGLERYAGLLPLGGHWYIQNGFGYDPAFHELPGNCVVDGVFQSEKFFAPVADLLRKHFSFRYPRTPAVARMEEQISKTNAVAVHFRRGDLLTNPQYKDTQAPLDAAYYKSCFKRMRSHVPGAVFYVFSDDLGYARECGICPDGSVFVDCVADWHAYDALRLMSLCRHFIIGNSTFSWWGAWLSEHDGKVVMYPRPWFSNMPQHDTKDLCPAHWHAMSRSGIDHGDHCGQ